MMLLFSKKSEYTKAHDNFYKAWIKLRPYQAKIYSEMKRTLPSNYSVSTINEILDVVHNKVVFKFDEFLTAIPQLHEGCDEFYQCFLKAIETNNLMSVLDYKEQASIRYFLKLRCTRCFYSNNSRVCKT